MTPADGRNVTEDRVISDRRDRERVLRKVVAPVATLLMIVIAALIWHFGSPRDDSETAPLQECSPPPGEKITI